jgi:hypothetical protein
VFGGLYAICAQPTPYSAIACGGHKSHRIRTDVDLDWRLIEDDRAVLELIVRLGVEEGEFRKCDIHNNNRVQRYGNAQPYTQ